VNDIPDYVHDTIVAPATPAGTGGVAIVRVSGDLTETIAETTLGAVPAARSATLAEFRDSNGELLDTGIALYFPAPASFTGESVLELHGHGGPTVVAMLVDALLELGARRAEAGEFSRRAYLNDKLDLAQAEAIADLIDSGSSQAARAALRSLSGEFSSAVDALAVQLTNLRLHVEAAIDFPEEEIDFLSDQQLLDRIRQCGEAFNTLKRNAQIGRVLRDGLQIVIIGRPNAGKSSLLNRLSGYESAIVTEVAGTTRDILREQIDIDGLAVEIIDTAGLRNDPDAIEAEGIRRAKEVLGKADAALWIVDASEPGLVDEALPEDDLPADTPVLIVRNKIDLTNDAPGLQEGEPATLNLSAKKGEGINELREYLGRLAGVKDLGEGAFTARRRHVDALELAESHYERGCKALQESRAGELLAEELRMSQQALGEITGALSSDDLLGKIFSEFCIGK
jgi:tRNA modification GTPase